MQSIPVFLDIEKFADFRKTQRVCHVIHTFFEFSLGEV